MLKTLLYSYIYLLSFNALSQDSVMYTRDLRLYEGIYINYQDFRYNWPIDKDKISTKIPKDQPDFFSKIVQTDVIEFKERDGSLERLQPQDIWGYCQNNIIFIKKGRDFFKISDVCAISNFIATVEVINNSLGFKPLTASLIISPPQKKVEIRNFLFDFYSGEIREFNIEKVEEYLKRDDLLLKEFMALRKKKKKELAFKYIRLYNEKHPVYFPK